MISLTYASAIDDPARFTSSKIVGAYCGMTPTRYQSGETDVSGSISRIGDAAVRAVLYEGAHVILTKPTAPARPSTGLPCRQCILINLTRFIR